MMHNDKHPLAGKTVKIKMKFPSPDSPADQELDFRLEDWWDRVAQRSWADCNGNPACINYAVRSAKARFPIDDEVVYGKVGAFGYLVHVSEIMASPITEEQR